MLASSRLTVGPIKVGDRKPAGGLSENRFSLISDRIARDTRKLVFRSSVMTSSKTTSPA
jgi:hypothetical protein